MSSIYRKRISTSQPFKMLVAHLERSSDPSKGESGNPVATRQSFQSQLITTPEGVGVRGIVGDQFPTAIVKVNSTEYGNTNVVAGPPFYDKDFIQIWAGGVEGGSDIRVLEAGNDFGRAQGNGQGNVNDVASSLASVLNSLKNLGIKAIVDPNDASQIIVSSLSPTEPLILNVRSVSFNLFAGNPPFLLLSADGGTLFDPTVSGKSECRVFIRSTGVAPMIIT